MQRFLFKVFIAFELQRGLQLIALNSKQNRYLKQKKKKPGCRKWVDLHNSQDFTVLIEKQQKKKEDN